MGWLLIHIFIVFLSLTAWAILGACLLAHFCRRRSKRQRWRLAILLCILWGMATCNAWYTTVYMGSLSKALLSVPLYVCAVLYSLSMIVFGVYLLHRSALIRIFYCKVRACIIPNLTVFSSGRSAKEKHKLIVFTPQEVERVEYILKSPEFLHNPQLKIGMLAQELATNKTYLSRYFNRQLGIGFPEYVTSLRLDEAERLLTETDKKVVEVSELVGFRSYSTFNDAFKARYKLPPVEWRNQVKEPPYGV